MRYVVKEKVGRNGPVFYVKDSARQRNEEPLAGVELPLFSRAEAEYLAWSLNDIEDRKRRPQ